MSDVILDVKCPHCGFVNRFIVDQYGGVRQVCCDLDEGGCDQYFVAIVERQYDIRVMKSDWIEQSECPEFGGPPF